MAQIADKGFSHIFKSDSEKSELLGYLVVGGKKKSSDRYSLL